MRELVKGASYLAKLAGQIIVQESKKGALMVYVPYSLVGLEFQETHSLCIGTKDGQLQEATLQNLRDIFGWTTENPFDLQRLDISTAPEFKLVDWHAEPYKKENGDDVDKWVFRWLNRAGSGVAPATDEEEAETMAKMGREILIGSDHAESRS